MVPRIDDMRGVVSRGHRRRSRRGQSSSPTIELDHAAAARIPQARWGNAKVKASQRGHRRRRLEGDRVHPLAARPSRGVRPSPPLQIEPGRRGDTAARRRRQNPPSCASSRGCSRLLGARSILGELWPNWRYHELRQTHRPAETTSDTQSSRRLPPKPRHSRARHQRPQRRLRAQPLPLGTVLRQRRLARLLRARAQPRPLGGPPRAHPPRAPTHRRGHHPQPAPHRAGPPRQPQRPTQTAPAAQLALAEHLHHRPATNPQPAPTHLSRPQRPAQRRPTPPATNPHQPRTPILHAPKRAGPHTRTSPAATRPQPPIPQARRWIQAKRAVRCCRRRRFGVLVQT